MFHPAALIWLWLVAVIMIQRLDLSGVLVAAGVLLALAGTQLTCVFVRWFSMIKRLRFLLLSIFIVFSFLTAGEPVAPEWWTDGWPEASRPSREGLLQAGEHLGRLGLVLWTVALAWVRLKRESFMAGIWGGLGPLRFFGPRAKLWSERALGRLWLTLSLMENPPERWRNWLDPVPLPDCSITFQVPPWQWRDSVLVGLASVAALGAVMSGVL